MRGARTGTRSTTTAPTPRFGFDRTASGSNAVAQYAPPLRDAWGRLDRVPDDYLLWFHHVPWDHRLASGRTLWDELTWRYCRGVVAVRDWQAAWRTLEGRIDAGRYEETRAFLGIQEQEARWWRDASVLYFQTFAKRPIAADACGPPRARSTSTGRSCRGPCRAAGSGHDGSGLKAARHCVPPV